LTSEVRVLDFEQGAVFSYQYDFGNGWRHTVLVEEFLTLSMTPVADLVDPEHTETIRWCGGHFDPGWFDLSIVLKDVRNANSLASQAVGWHDGKLRP